jgi:DNA-binding NarL/FixJ family response regulator
MIRVLISAPSPAALARLANRLRSFPQFQLVAAPFDAPSDQIGSSADLQPDVHLAVVDNEDQAAIALDDSPDESRDESLDESVDESPDESRTGIPLILLLPNNPATLVDAIRQRAHAVLPNNLTDSQLAAAIEAVAAGLGVFVPNETQIDETPDEILDTARPFASHLPPPRLPEALTSREIEVLRAMADGFSNKEIALRLKISENTAKFHVGSVMGKLGARSRTEAVMLGVRYGIVLI